MNTAWNCVNALNRAVLISTVSYDEAFVPDDGCVNALNRAVLISTLPF